MNSSQERQKRQIHLEAWISEQLWNRFASVRFFDPWDVYEINGVSELLTDFRYVSEYISREQHDSLVKEIGETFSDFRDLDFIRINVMNRCRYIMTCMEKSSFCGNMHRLIKWSIENAQISRQLTKHFRINHNVPNEIIYEIFSYALPLPKPAMISVREFERQMSHCIDGPDARGGRL